MTVSIELHHPTRSGLRAWALLLLPAFALGLALGLLPSGRVALACSCLPLPPPAQMLAAASHVFDGTATHVEILDPANPTFSTLRVTFAVHTQWKGVTGGQFVVHTAANGASCGFPFRLGSRYIVYGEQFDNRTSVSNCGRTRPYDAAEAAALGPSSPPPGAVPVDAWHGQPPGIGCPRCAPPLPPREAMAAAAAVFHGRLQALEFLGPAHAHDHLATFQNLGWWKGPDSPSIQVRLPWNVWNCDRFWGESGAWGDYLVYADTDDGGGLKLSLCGRTNLYDPAEAEALGPPNPPLAATPTGSPNPNETPSGTPSSTPSATRTPTTAPITPCTPPACPCGRLVGQCPNQRCEVCTATPTGTWRPPPAYLPWGEKR